MIELVDLIGMDLDDLLQDVPLQLGIVDTPRPTAQFDAVDDQIVVFRADSLRFGAEEGEIFFVRGGEGVVG